MSIEKHYESVRKNVLAEGMFVALSKIPIMWPKISSGKEIATTVIHNYHGSHREFPFFGEPYSTEGLLWTKASPFFLTSKDAGYRAFSEQKVAFHEAPLVTLSVVPEERVDLSQADAIAMLSQYANARQFTSRNVNINPATGLIVAQPVYAKAIQISNDRYLVKGFQLQKFFSREPDAILEDILSGQGVKEYSFELKPGPSGFHTACEEFAESRYFK